MYRGFSDLKVLNQKKPTALRGQWAYARASSNLADRTIYKPCVFKVFSIYNGIGAIEAVGVKTRVVDELLTNLF